jgi:protein-S-isoprenylcysteine O-methyltransferase Ste14
MIAWINFVVLIAMTLLTLVFYIKSVGPAALERKIGPAAYEKCGRYRLVAMIAMTVGMVNYVLYYFFPLPLPLPLIFPWSWGISVAIGVLIAIPSGYLLARGMKDAGEETMAPKKEHGLYGGIYEKIRHPQAWEAVLWFTAAFLLNSPFLALYSFLWLIVEYVMVMAEERDLVIRFGQAYVDYRRRTGAFWPRRQG